MEITLELKKKKNQFLFNIMSNQSRDPIQRKCENKLPEENMHF